MLTYKVMKKTSDKAELMKQYKEELKLSDEAVGNYWHLKQYKVDYKAVCESLDKVNAMKNQIDSILVNIKIDLEKIAEKLV